MSANDHWFWCCCKRFQIAVVDLDTVMTGNSRPTDSRYLNDPEGLLLMYIQT